MLALAYNICYTDFTVGEIGGKEIQNESTLKLHKRNEIHTDYARPCEAHE